MIRFDFGQATASAYDADDFPVVQYDAFGEGKSGVAPYRLTGPYGLWTIPIEPSKSGGCQLLLGEDGRNHYAWTLNDPRVQSLLPKGKPGETFFYGPTGSFVRHHTDGRISLYTTDDATPIGRTVALALAPTGLTYNFPYGKQAFDATGFHVLHNSGARIDLGALGGLPFPLDTLASYVTLSAAIVRIEGSVISLGTAAGIAEPITKALSLATEIFVPLALALEAVNASLVAIGETPPITANAGSQTAIAAATAAIQTASVALTSAVALVGSSSVMAT